MAVDFGQLARELGLGAEQIQRTVGLLDDGNTVPFITRYRKDQTGGLDEEQIRRIQQVVATQRMLAERKVTILKSIESQGKLTPELAEQINSTTSTKRLEDLYLPYKPKKQTLATLARERGLEPLAEEVLSGDPAAFDLPARAQFFVNPDRQLKGLADVLQGVGHLLAERFSERADLRGRLRKILWKTGKLVTSAVPPRAEAAESAEEVSAATEGKKTQSAEKTAESTAAAPSGEKSSAAEAASAKPPAVDAEQAATTSEKPTEAPAPQGGAEQAAAVAQAITTETPATEAPANETPSSAEPTAAEQPPATDAGPKAESAAPAKDASPADAAAADAGASTQGEQPVSGEAGAANQSSEISPAETKAADQTDAANSAQAQPTPAAQGERKQGKSKEEPTQQAVAREKKKKKKKAKKDKTENAFKDYFDFQEAVTNLPPHRVLAINRGERAKAIRVRIEADWAEIEKTADELLVPSDHPHAELLRTCVRDALNRLVLPSLEREIRRELTERAEQHAVEVFARNLRNLLLQPPVRGKRLLAIDPGYRSGCKLTALDEFGNVLDHGVLHIVGKAERRARGRRLLVDLIDRHNVSVIALGNGTGSRETEKLVAAVLAEELAGRDVAYVFVNEAGASVYSTSELGREELPKCDAVQRSAVSIGRRLLDPLSELVKINPANIGVGMYQHDVKASHLRNSLDDVVESCVNYVGVDVNTASPALLRYVSGLNQLTARRLYEYRREHGPFRSREQFREVPGFGAAAFVQAAGFLKINGGDNPLDATWIHPESYQVAKRVLAKLDFSLEELAVTTPPPALATAAPSPQPIASPAESPAAAESQPSAAVEDSSAGQTATAGEGEAAATTRTPPGPGAEADGAAPPAGIPAEASPTETTAAEQEPPAPQSEASSAATTPVPAAEPTPTSEPAAANGHAAASAAPARSALLARLAEKAAQVDAQKLADELHVGRLLLSDILTSLARPGRDPRDDLPPPLFRRGVAKLEDLEPGMELSATVLNVVDFGAFVDIGLSDSGLVHISRLADRYVRDPHEVVAVGDTLRVWVVEVDKQRRRVSLTAIEPGRERPRREKPSGRPPRQRDGKPRGRGEGKAPQGRGRGDKKRGGPPKPYQTQTKRKPKPVKPITKAMQEGREPMRSFSDLQQFFQKKQDEDGESKDKS